MKKHTTLNDNVPLDSEYTYQHIVIREGSFFAPIFNTATQNTFHCTTRTIKNSEELVLIRLCMVFCIRCVFSIKFCYSAKKQQPANGMRILDDNENRISDTQNAKIILDSFVPSGNF